MIHNFHDFLDMMEANALKDFASMRALCEQSPLFKEQVQRYIAENPKKYARFSEQALAIERALARELALPQAQNQGMGNVHDPLLTGPRTRTSEWLLAQSNVRKAVQSTYFTLYL